MSTVMADIENETETVIEVEETVIDATESN